jgi:hypothetical protein
MARDHNAIHAAAPFGIHERHISHWLTPSWPTLDRAETCERIAPSWPEVLNTPRRRAAICLPIDRSPLRNSPAVSGAIIAASESVAEIDVMSALTVHRRDHKKGE